MRKPFGPFLAVSLAAVAVSLLVLAGRAEAACLSAGESRQAIASGQARPLNAILRREGLSGDVVRVSLCENGRRLEYRVSVLLANGKLVNRTLAAN